MHLRACVHLQAYTFARTTSYVCMSECAKGECVYTREGMCTCTLSDGHNNLHVQL
eukprot:m.258327 g.258327  ORF g.258327 m.258327 type:complete len:55 (-) comp36431_c0_seq1:809-973(-)